MDGLRGIAALIVLVHHCLLVAPSLSVFYTSVTPSTGRGAWARALALSPLHLVWAGREAVIVFFVLSGYVLVRPHVASASDGDGHANGDHEDWSGYYGKRLVRLYVPVWIAIVVAAVLVHAVHRAPIDGGSGWLNLHAHPYTLTQFRDDALLLFQPGTYTTVLWSLRYEVIFSLLLPLFVVFGRVSRRATAGCVVVIGAVMGLSGVTDPVFQYLPMFAVGAVIVSTESTWRPRLAAWLVAVRWYRRTLVHLGWIVLICALWLTDALPGSIITGHEQSQWVLVSTTMAATLGAAIIVMLVIADRMVARIMESRPLQWLGSRSYSLYLVHEPIVVTTAFVTKGWSWPGSLAAIAMALVVAELFYRCIERPSIALARRTGAAVRRLAA